MDISTRRLRCASYSRYAARALQARPALADTILREAAAPLSAAWMNRRLAELGAEAGDPDLKRALRQLRTEVFCIVMERDLAGRADLDEVTATMSDLAEVAVTRALDALYRDLAEQHGEPRGGDGEIVALGVLGMGKLGGRELNVSSDIDLIFVYEDDGQTTGGQRSSLSNHEFFNRLGRRLINALADVTSDGYVFRVDMRLRPNGDAGPLACSLGMLEEYFYVQGREWERYAWIKARLVSETQSAPARRLSARLDELVAPFVFRRYLDFGAIDALRRLHAQIRQEAQRRASLRPAKADDVKLGRGGIREVEFSAQVFQLIRGGQDPGFRLKQTLAVLAHAAAQGVLAAEAAEQLSDAYLLLRQTEHRLQYLDDAQTHALPVDGQDRQRIAVSLGYPGFEAFKAVLDRHRARVEAHFNSVFSEKTELPDSARIADAGNGLWSAALCDGTAAAALSASAAALGFAAAGDVVARLSALRCGTRYNGLTDSSRVRFDALMSRAIDTIAHGAAASRDATLMRFVDLLDAVSRRGAYLALLTEYPAALQRVLDVLSASRWAAGYLTRHPQLLDELLDDDALNAPFDWDAFRANLSARLAAADGVEHRMDLLRNAHRAEAFRILLLDLGGRLSVERISDYLSELADAVLDVTLEAVWQSLPRRHRETPRFAIVAYGKLGGKELGYMSDLDLIFLYDDTHEAAAEIYVSLARRLISWLTTATGAGQLFDVDLRLRPSGESGLLVTDLDAFRRYQLREGGANTAWVWEHQALTRARYCAGDASIGAAFDNIRTQVLATPREADALAREIVSMRERVLAGHPNGTASFDLKHDRGGMVDIEFTVQYLVLLHAFAHRSLIANTGNINLLREIARLGLTTEREAETVGNAYRTYRGLQHRLRLDGMDAARVDPEQVAPQRAAVLALWRRVFGEQAPAGSV